MAIAAAVLAPVAGGANNRGMMRLLRSVFARVPVCALLLVIAGSPALAACDDDEIAFIALDGSLIRMRSGAVFHVRSSDQFDASLWLALDDVLICNDETEIINKDEDGARVSAKRVHR
jgi:hypothetical protein